MIENYKFGSIKIDGKVYESDVEVRWNGEVLAWPREESHLFKKKDVERALKQNPDVLILGTGAYGEAKVSPEAQRIIAQKGVLLVIDLTEKAVEAFNMINLLEKSNELSKRKKVIALLHLTC